MEFFYLILLLLLFLLIKIYTDSFRIKIFFEMDQEGTRLEVFYLRPFLKVLVDIENDRPFLRIYIFNIRIARMQIQSKKRKKHFLKLIKNIKASHIRVATYYGLDPYLTGLLCGAINVAKSYLNVEKIEHYPDFTSNREYFRLEATANIYIGHSFSIFAKNKV